MLSLSPLSGQTGEEDRVLRPPPHDRRRPHARPLRDARLPPLAVAPGADAARPVEVDQDEDEHGAVPRGAQLAHWQAR